MGGYDHIPVSGCGRSAVRWVWSKNRRVDVLTELLGGCNHRTIGWVWSQSC